MSTERWQDTLLDEHGEQVSELRDSPLLDRYKTPNEALRGFIETKSKLGRSFSMPAKDATPEERNEWLNGTVKQHLPEMMLKPDYDSEDGAKATWASLGVPDDGKYDNPDDVGGLSDDILNDMLEMSKKVGHTSKQHQASVELMREMQVAANAGMTERQEQETDMLKELWGGAYDQNIGITDELANQHNKDNPDLPLGQLNNAARVFILGYAKSVSSDPQVFNQVNSPTNVPSPTEARLEMSEMQRTRASRGNMTKEENQAWIRKFNKLVALAS